MKLNLSMLLFLFITQLSFAQSFEEIKINAE